MICLEAFVTGSPPYSTDLSPGMALNIEEIPEKDHRGLAPSTFSVPDSFFTPEGPVDILTNYRIDGPHPKIAKHERSTPGRGERRGAF